MIPNRFIRHRVNTLLDAIGSGAFDEHSVRSLIMDLRSHAPPGSCLREIGDFLAHPDKRDRGVVYSRVLGTSKDLRTYFDILYGRIPGDRKEIEIRLCFYAEAVVDMLCSMLVQVGISQRSDPRLMPLLLRRSELALCIAVLLQGAVFEIAEMRPTAFLSESPERTTALLVRFDVKDVGGRQGVFIGFPVIQTNYPWRAYALTGLEGVPAGTFYRLAKDSVRGFHLIAELGSEQP